MFFRDIKQRINEEQHKRGNFFSYADAEIQVYSPDGVNDLVVVFHMRQEPIAKFVFHQEDRLDIYFKDAKRANSLSYKKVPFSADEPLSALKREAIAKEYPVAAEVHKVLAAVLSNGKE